MTTTHANCLHPATKLDRSRCRRTMGKALAGTTVRPDGHLDTHVVEACMCGDGPVTNGHCDMCDRPVRVTMTSLGLLLTA
jgi:hypothetical protein